MRNWSAQPLVSDGAFTFGHMTSTPEEQPALAQMIHQSDVATWLVRVVGRSLVILFVCPLIAGGIGAAIDAPELFALGGVVGFLALLFYLTGTVAPYPSDTVVKLLDGDGGN